MALGDITGSGHLHTIELLASATGTNSPPSGAAAGIDVSTIITVGRPQKCSFLLASTAGSATMTVTVRLFGYHPATSSWHPLGTGTGAAKGILNAGAAIDEGPVADKIRHAEPLDLPVHFSRLYLEITAIGGTATAVTAYLTWTDRD